MIATVYRKAMCGFAVPLNASEHTVGDDRIQRDPGATYCGRVATIAFASFIRLPGHAVQLTRFVVTDKA